MFIHNFKYEFLHSIRQKDVIFWLIVFPIILGTFFKMAFSGIYEKAETFNAIPIAVVENVTNETFDSVMDSVSSGNDALFKVEKTDKNDALNKLENEDITAIIYINESITMSVSGEGIEQTIVKTFLEQYQVSESVIMDTIKNNPQNLENVIAGMSKEVKASENIPLTNGNMDFMIQYFYNLIAMVCVLGSMTGLHISIENQGNLSQLGARKCLSPCNKFVSIMASLTGSFIVQGICSVVSVTFINFVLGVDMGNKIFSVYIAAIIGGILGVSMGFFVGSFGKMSEGAKTSIAMTVSMTSCFFSGLMVGNMKPLIEENLPIFNRINPAAIISDSFYCLNVYPDYERFMEKIITMLLISAVFIVGGFLLTRNKKYKSL